MEKFIMVLMIVDDALHKTKCNKLPFLHTYYINLKFCFNEWENEISLFFVGCAFFIWSVHQVDKFKYYMVGSLSCKWDF